MFEIKGSDFDDGVIAAGAEMNCEYEVLDSGNIMMEVSVPSIGGSFHSGRNFYSRQEGQIDYTKASKLVVLGVTKYEVCYFGTVDTNQQARTLGETGYCGDYLPSESL